MLVVRAKDCIKLNKTYVGAGCWYTFMKEVYRMKEQIILDITQEMLPYLDNAQLLHLRKVLERVLWNVEITESPDKAEEPSSAHRGRSSGHHPRRQPYPAWFHGSGSCRPLRTA